MKVILWRTYSSTFRLSAKIALNVKKYIDRCSGIFHHQAGEWEAAADCMFEAQLKANQYIPHINFFNAVNFREYAFYSDRKRRELEQYLSM